MVSSQRVAELVLRMVIPILTRWGWGTEHGSVTIRDNPTGYPAFWAGSSPRGVGPAVVLEPVYFPAAVKAPIPVSWRPMMRAWTSSVPS